MFFLLRSKEIQLPVLKFYYVTLYVVSGQNKSKIFYFKIMLLDKDFETILINLLSNGKLIMIQQHKMSLNHMFSEFILYM